MDWLSDDIALIHLSSPLGVPKYVKMEGSNRRYVGFKALIAGWGTIDEHCTQLDNVLREGDTYIDGNSACSQDDWTFNWTELVCTVHINSTNKAVAGAGCGDSGGPLFILDNGELIQVGIVSYTSGGRDHFTRVFTYLEWIDGILNSPPAQSQMPRPRCFNSCCDDPDYLDSYGEECHTWKGYDCPSYEPQNAGLLQKCMATCKQCPSCEATNLQCCDTVGYRDAVGDSCSSWRGYDCTRSRFLRNSELRDLQNNCPKSCGWCSPGTDCTDEEEWLDSYGFACIHWRGYDCSKATANFGYKADVQAELLKRCPLTCGLCQTSTATVTNVIAEDSSTNVIAEDSSSSSSSTVPFQDVFTGMNFSWRQKIHYLVILASLLWCW